MKTTNKSYAKGLIACALLIFSFQLSFAQWSTSGNSLSTGNFLGSTNATDLVFKTNNTTRMIIKSDGNVGIGTTNTSGFLLSVDGKIRAREVRINMDTWADYVFADTYKPMNLTELELFIKKNKHLPCIPCEQEVITSGISINEITLSLIQKIEEITLYTIEINKKMADLQLLVAKQQAELELLKNPQPVKP